MHFRWEGPILIGRTAVGRAPVAVLQFHRDDSINLLRNSLIGDRNQLESKLAGLGFEPVL
jgi:hypothetical protein